MDRRFDFPGTFDIRMVPLEEATEKLQYDGNRTALWELHRRLLGLGPRD